MLCSSAKVMQFGILCKGISLQDNRRTPIIAALRIYLFTKKNGQNVLYDTAVAAIGQHVRCRLGRAMLFIDNNVMLLLLNVIKILPHLLV